MIPALLNLAGAKTYDQGLIELEYTVGR